MHLSYPDDLEILRICLIVPLTLPSYPRLVLDIERCRDINRYFAADRDQFIEKTLEPIEARPKSRFALVFLFELFARIDPNRLKI